MPARRSACLGADFHKLWSASAISTIGDGVTMVAGPLLVTSLTSDPALVAGAAFAQQLPVLLFSLISGVYVDRVDRQRLIVLIHLLRGLDLTAQALTIVLHIVTIPVIYTVFFLLGTGDTVAGTASAARLPSIVPADALPTANTRLMATYTIGNQFLAKPLGAALFVIAVALPFSVDAVTFFAAAALVAAMRPTPDPAPRQDANLRAEITEGLRWLCGHRLLRTLALSMGVGNIVLCGAFAILVLYARRRLGLSDVGYGYLLVTFAVGALLGTATAGRLQARFGAATLLRTGLLVETATHISLAVATNSWAAAATLVVFGAHTMIWGVIVTTLIQRSVPSRLLGRVNSVYALILEGGAALGSLLGGIFAHSLGLTAPFWIAAVVMAFITATAWKPLRQACIK